MTDAARLWLRGALAVTLLVDLCWAGWPIWSIVSWNAQPHGVGSVSMGIDERTVLLLFIVPLVLHGLAQGLARALGADVRRIWRWHLIAAAVVAGLTLALAVAPLAVLALAGSVALLVGQHVLLTMTVAQGLRAVRR